MQLNQDRGFQMQGAWPHLQDGRRYPERRGHGKGLGDSGHKVNVSSQQTEQERKQGNIS